MRPVRVGAAQPTFVGVLALVAVYPLVLIALIAVLGAARSGLLSAGGGLLLSGEWVLSAVLGLAFGLLAGWAMLRYPFGRRLWLVGLAWAAAFTVASVSFAAVASQGFSGGAVANAPSGVVLPVMAALGLWLLRYREG
jgi:hypothetical protein